MIRWIGLAALLIAAFGWGLAAGAYDVFPYPQLRAAKGAIFGAEAKRGNDYSMTEVPVISAERYETLKTRADIAMVGDSITASGRWDELFPGASIINRGVNGDVVGGVEKRAATILRAAPKTVFLMIGINDIVAGNTNAQIVERYRAALDNLGGDGATIYVQSVIPCRDFRLGPCNAKVRAQAFALNPQLEQLALEGGAQFIDLAAEMADEDGFLPQYSIDGVHPGSAGFEKWREIIAPHVEAE